MTLKRTPLYEFHKQLGAKLVPFAGYEMPVQYPLGTIKEHIHTRTKVGVFDVSHMGQVAIYPKGKEALNGIIKKLEGLLPIDLENIRLGRQKYALITNEKAGIIDDIMITKKEKFIYLIVNAANKREDINYLQAQLGSKAELVEIEDRALLAIQGPEAAEITCRILPELKDMRFLDVMEVDSEFGELWVSRSGYTGEDGFEISLPSASAEAFAEQLQLSNGTEFIGLAARDSLRLEAGLCLHGNDIDESTTVIEAGLWWSVSKTRRPGNIKEGGFPGYGILVSQLNEGVQQMLVGLKPQGRAPIRSGNRIYNSAIDGEEVGRVTSGGFGPTVNGPIAMGYLRADEVGKNTVFYCEGRRARLPINIHLRRFVGTSFNK